MEMQAAPVVRQRKFAAGAVAAAEIGRGEALALYVEGDLQIVPIAQSGRIGESRVSSAEVADLVDLQAFLSEAAAAGHNVVLFRFSAASVNRLPASILRQDVAKLHIAEVRLVNKPVLPD